MILAALCLTEICDGTVFNNNLIHVVKLAIESFKASLSLFLRSEFYIYIPHHVLSNIVCDHEVKDLSIVTEFSENLIVEAFEVQRCLNQFLWGHLEAICKSDGRSVVLVKLKKQKSLT